KKSASRATANLKMSDIARMAGVAKSTVSRALADSDQVSRATKARIRQIARDHDYQLDVAARDFRHSQSRTVKVLVPHGAAGVPMFTDPFVMDLLASIADALSDRDYNMLLSKVTLSSPGMLRDSFHSRNAEGVIVLGQRRFHEELNAMAESQIPLVIWGARFPDQKYCSVGSDNVAGARAAVRHLIKRGCERILFLGDTAMAEPRLRFSGYKTELERADIDFDESLVVATQYDRLSAYAAMTRCLDEGLQFDGIFGTSDVVAMSAISALHDHNISVPGDVAVVGYDDVTLASYFSPALTTVRQNIPGAGAHLVDSVLRLAGGEQVSSHITPTELVVRKSCGALD
ncbi:MAG: substrate-binding domain-containing protein, partial [Pseudomonadota bacterium]